MAGWKQLLFDWDKADRDRGALVSHLRLCGMPEADEKLIMAIQEKGEWTRDGEIARSVLKATIRHVAKLAGLSVGGAHKAKGRLILRRVLTYHAGVWVLSWSRIWSLEYAPDAKTVALFQGAAVRACSRSPQSQESRRQSTPTSSSNTNNQQEASTEEVRQYTADELAAACRLDVALVERIVRRILSTVRPLECRHEIDPEYILQTIDAERIAHGILGCADGYRRNDLGAVLRSMDRKATFTSSPAAFLVRCAQRRGWLNRASHPGAVGNARRAQRAVSDREGS